MKIAIASFAKTIGYSPVKTRLAKRIETQHAEAFYRLSVACVRAVLEQVSKEKPNVFPHWALADEKAVGLAEWQCFPNLWTGEGGLGTRLSSISNRLLDTHDCVFLIGTDSPHLSAENILKFVRQYEANPKPDHVVGPASDGGFWLWGSRKPLPKAVWEAVQYSVDSTLSELIAEVEVHGDSVGKGEVMQDVDEFEDLPTLEAELKKRETDLLPAQTELLKWLQETIPTFRV